MVHAAADTAVPPARAGASCPGDLALFLGLDSSSAGQGRLPHVVYKTFSRSNLNAYHWDTLN